MEPMKLCDPNVKLINKYFHIEESMPSQAVTSLILTVAKSLNSTVHHRV
jgi:hypothetical protein